ncbi:plasmid replication protein RepC [Donghicola sp.]|jgi:replication initiation protein RepC|uniref:plasmid replication protein RepC n=1 Tax=Donghicola sp. TaxID=1929294 RepID=UPI0025E9649C|nr:plasmid replication protein RepC [Donghicola sp.]MCT4578083.1 plasmid replication protein RepC [Donghicola sp.]
MEHISTTPFGRRPVSAGQLAAQQMLEAPIPDTVPDKWTIIKELTAARLAFGVTDRDLAVLNALVSFHPHDSLADGEGTIVFPSNAALSERAHGMAESTLRRHLAALVNAQLIIRHDSPNGKRYAARGVDGGIDRAFGFDLRPLLVRLPEIGQAAREARAAALRLKRLREAVVLRLRDAAKLIAFGKEEVEGNWDQVEDRLKLMQRSLRRKLYADELNELNLIADQLLADVNVILSHEISKEMSGNDDVIERHLQYSNIKHSDSEPSLEKERAAEVEPSPQAKPKLPLYLVVKACPDLNDYIPTGIHSWPELVTAANFIRPMLGISDDAWRRAEAAMGSEAAAITVVGILQRASEIRSPGGYLRALTSKAESGAFSPGPMIMALLATENQRAM